MKSSLNRLIEFLERDHALSQILEAVKREKQQNLLRSLKKELKEKNVLLKIALQGDTQRVKNFMQHDKYMQRYFPFLDSQVRSNFHL